MLALAFAGLGLILALLICGTLVSNLTVRVIGVEFPAASRAVTTTVFVPSASVIALEKLPSAFTVIAPTLTPFNVAVTVTGLDTASFVVPLKVMLGLLVIRPAVGLLTSNWGFVVSVVKDADTAAAALPS